VNRRQTIGENSLKGGFHVGSHFMFWNSNFKNKNSNDNWRTYQKTTKHTHTPLTLADILRTIGEQFVKGWISHWFSLEQFGNLF
jgi:hypothetical protein